AQLIAVSDLKTRRGSRQKSSVESFSRRLRFAGRDQRKRTLTDHTVSAQSRRRLIDVTDHVRRVYDSKHVGCAGRESVQCGQTFAAQPFLQDVCSRLVPTHASSMPLDVKVTSPPAHATGSASSDLRAEPHSYPAAQTLTVSLGCRTAMLSNKRDAVLRTSSAFALADGSQGLGASVASCLRLCF